MKFTPAEMEMLRLVVSAALDNALASKRSIEAVRLDELLHRLSKHESRSYLVRANNNVSLALSMCAAISEDRACKLLNALSFDAWIAVCRALNDGNTGQVMRLLDL